MKNHAMDASMAVATVSAALLAFIVPMAHAADAYPAKPMTVVVPFSAGGDGDRSARNLSVSASVLWEQPAPMTPLAPCSSSKPGPTVIRRCGHGTENRWATAFTSTKICSKTQVCR
ncbi:hypothetical protein [Verminephrobacter eiseniae]|uniref:hypothetical protein n=1 Tax=Verminephrobacter eiseniae TaxID=364317 RepID=UPI0022384F5F|nr:hypothetical protein [Verminephrobacter eiseniae]